MPSTFKPYNKRSFIEIGGKQVPKERCVLTLLEGHIADNPDIELSTDRAYRRMPDGSLRRIKPEDIKRGRKIIVEDRP